MRESADKEWLDQMRRSRDLADEQIRQSKLTIEKSKALLRLMDEIAQVEIKGVAVQEPCWALQCRAPDVRIDYRCTAPAYVRDRSDSIQPEDEV
jgi:hypothetical protein